MEYLTNIIPYFKVIRPKNLLIIIVTMSILQYGVISPLSGGKVALTFPVFLLFVLVTVILAAGANLINDIFDHQIDSINKPGKTYVEKVIPLTSAWKYYWSLQVMGLVIALIVGIQSNQWYNLWIYPLAAWALYAYSRFWKGKVLLGNIVVSLFVAWVWGILFYAQLAVDIPGETTKTGTTLSELCIVYFLFAFLINLIREIIKDIEDIEGDKSAGIKTLPIYAGIPKTKSYVISGIIFFIMIFSIWLFTSEITKHYEVRFYHVVFIIMPSVLCITHVMKAHEKKNYSFLSALLKLMMLFALGGLLIICKYFES